MNALAMCTKTEGHAESFQVEAKGGHIFVNVPDAGNVVESIDQKSGAVTKWPLKGLRGNYARPLNEEDHRLFTITRKTPMMVVLTPNSASRLLAYAQRVSATMFSLTHRGNVFTRSVEKE
jgi:hypothetical protein